MKQGAASRTILITLFLVGGLFLLTPMHYWGVLAAVLKAAAMVGLTTLGIRRWLRSH